MTTTKMYKYNKKSLLCLDIKVYIKYTKHTIHTILSKYPMPMDPIIGHKQVNLKFKKKAM